ncbi:hypothetical protein [Streptomyces violascens]|uniref:hypothetical protein n=1 Tax=Streptomyces violascens TaxID=67381 RepID=UPI0036976589
MPHPGTDTSIRLGKHHDHPSAVTATIVGKSLHAARALLSLQGFEPTDETTMVMVRIDHEEPHYAQEAAQGLTVDAGPPSPSAPTATDPASTFTARTICAPRPPSTTTPQRP